MRKMITEYELEADRLKEYSKLLARRIEESWDDIDLVNRLRKRKALADIERYEILCDINSMREYVS